MIGHCGVLVRVDGFTLLTDPQFSTHAGPGGETIVTMISDDNYNHGLQRTVLLQFAISAGDLVASSGGAKADQP